MYSQHLRSNGMFSKPRLCGTLCGCTCPSVDVLVCNYYSNRLHPPTPSYASTRSTTSPSPLPFDNTRRTVHRSHQTGLRLPQKTPARPKQLLTSIPSPLLPLSLKTTSTVAPALVLLWQLVAGIRGVCVCGVCVCACACVRACVCVRGGGRLSIHIQGSRR